MFFFKDIHKMFLGRFLLEGLEDLEACQPNGTVSRG